MTVQQRSMTVGGGSKTKHKMANASTLQASQAYCARDAVWRSEVAAQQHKLQTPRLRVTRADRTMLTFLEHNLLTTNQERIT